MWLAVLPITSFVVLPAQGTTPANLLTLLLVFPLTGILLLPGASYQRYWLSFGGALLIIGIFFFASRFSVISYSQSLSGLKLVNPAGILPATMVANVTQTIYLMVGITVFIITYQNYKSNWDKFIFLGAWILVIYGFADFLSQTLFRFNLDFLSNRTFTEGRFEHPGSLRQMISVLGLQVLRFKSFTGEPSMFAITALAYLPIAIVKDRRFLAGSLIAALLLSFSTSAYLGLLILSPLIIRRIPFLYVAIGAILALVFATIAVWIEPDKIYDTFYSLFISKLMGESHSGSSRISIFLMHFNAWIEAPLLPFLLGFGFGTVRSTDLLGTLLVNMGLVGTLLYFWLVFALLTRAIRLGRTVEALGFFAVAVVMLIAVPEFAYLPPWLLAGFALRERKDDETTF